jgi:hypothetical protein
VLRVVLPHASRPLLCKEGAGERKSQEPQP